MVLAVPSLCAGEFSVDPNKVAAFTYTPILTAISGNVGSLAGGQAITLTAAGAGFNTTSLTGNEVTVGGAACTVTAVPDENTLTCTTPSMYGHVLAEYWNLPSGTYSYVDLLGFTNPVARRLEAGGVSKVWSVNPAPGVNYDNWGAKFTFHFQVSTPDTYQFRFSSCDDVARLYATPPNRPDGERVMVASCGYSIGSSSTPFSMEQGGGSAFCLSPCV